jgi:hypothetical protein
VSIVSDAKVLKSESGDVALPEAQNDWAFTAQVHHCGGRKRTGSRVNHACNLMFQLLANVFGVV